MYSQIQIEIGGKTCYIIHNTTIFHALYQNIPISMDENTPLYNTRRPNNKTVVKLGVQCSVYQIDVLFNHRHHTTTHHHFMQMEEKSHHHQRHLFHHVSVLNHITKINNPTFYSWENRCVSTIYSHVNGSKIFQHKKRQFMQWCYPIYIPV